MEKFLVSGGHSLKGNFIPTGNKNESLPVMAASLMTDESVVLENIPLIEDFLVMRKIAEDLGVKIAMRGPKTMETEASEIHDQLLNPDLCQKIRGSFLFAAPMLHRFGSVKLPIPGGDTIGRRRLDTHLLAFESFGVSVEKKEKCYALSTKKLQGASILLDEASVMATENAVMIAAVAEGESIIYNAACEPHVQGLCHMLNAMGAHIEGIGSNRLRISGRKQLHGCSHRILPDHIEICSIIGLAAITRSELTIKNCEGLDLGLIPLFFEKLGIRLDQQKDSLRISKKQEMKIQKERDSFLPKIDDGPWPLFPADLTSIMTIVATQCEGSILIFEKMFESRLFWVDKLIGMGASIVLCDPHRAVVNGPTKLLPGNLNSPDIRAGMALLLAAMCAEGKSQIANIGQIDRGYEKIDERLNALGAKIERV